MYLPKDASRSRIREAQKARDNRAEIVRALSHGEISRRELFKWGLFTSSGLLAWKNGLNVYAPSAYGQVPTGTPATKNGTNPVSSGPGFAAQGNKPAASARYGEGPPAQRTAAAWRTGWNCPPSPASANSLHRRRRRTFGSCCSRARRPRRKRRRCARPAASRE